jgi:NADP-dependent 3-hydroxy-3-methylglutaryl-CoA reductase
MELITTKNITIETVDGINLNVTGLNGNSLIINVAEKDAIKTPIGKSFINSAIYHDNKLICKKDIYVYSITKKNQENFIVELKTEEDDLLSTVWVYLKNEMTSNNISPHVNLNEKIPVRGKYTDAARLQRLCYLEEKTGTTINHIRETSLKNEDLKNNIESFIGTIEIPVGIAGPLLIHGREMKGLIYAPFATTEGALIASATRGAKALTLSGGVSSWALSKKMIRAPVFEFNNIPEALCVAYWLKMNIDLIRHHAERHSHYAKLTKLDIFHQGKYLHVYFIYETGDAAGQNMTTMCTDKACEWIKKELRDTLQIPAISFIIDGNLSSDKKVSGYNMHSGRGTRVMSECFIPENIINRVLGTTSKDFMHAYNIMLASSITMGAIGFNINSSNVIAAMFVATGQDIASVHEASLSQLYAELSGDGIYLCLTLPCLTIGTIGGGTGLPAQNECLKILNCSGKGKINRLAEIICAYCMALDLSTISAAAAGEFARAHEQMGRNRPPEN